MNNLSRIKGRLEKHIQSKNNQESVQLFHELAISHARKKDFKKAEMFRDRLYDLDPLALSEIIQVNEIIDEEKNQGIDPGHREIFSDLYGDLSIEEGNALFYGLEKMTAPVNESVFQQGATCPWLIFVNQGKLRVSCGLAERNVLIKTLEPGSIFGEDTFFLNSISTTTVTALSTSVIHRLDKGVFLNLKKDAPGLEKKLMDFCLKGDTVSDLLRQKGIDRRSLRRIKIFNRGLIQLLDISDKLIGKAIRIELSDISLGGASFLLRISNEEKAGIMLGRRIVIQYGSNSPSSPLFVQKTGTVVALSPKTFDDYSFHIQFDRKLTPDKLDAISSAFSSP